MARRRKSAPRAAKSTRKARPAEAPQADSYRHPTAETLLRPDVGTQAQFRKKKPPVAYSYDSSLSPALDFDGQNHARELGEWLLATIEEAARLPAPHVFSQPREFKDARGRPALRGAYSEAVWDHLAGTVSAPFEAGEHGQVAVKVIDDRGNELLVVKDFKEAQE